MVVATKKKTRKRVVSRARVLASVDALIDEMDGVNVNNHPLQAHVLARWVEGWQGIRDDIDALSERKVKKKG